ncbi:lipid-transfer protein [Pelomonas sp. KK5]|uniref:lipid-transfer protein n=1 Tax=Pelomonas sp. KK5 TaxID=1855730 RepID=UPI00097BF172|nr:lipid-transfer protein [Pelomonas sp. KK5]
MTERVFVAGVGMVPFTKPGAGEPYFMLGAEAARLALADAGLDYGQVQQAYAGYVYGDSTSGQRALYEVGLSGIPVVNVNNNCSSGSTALFLARQAVQSGAVDCALAVGFEQMKPGAIAMMFDDRPSATATFDAVADELFGHPHLPMAVRLFGGAGAEHMQRYGTSLRTFAEIRAKASRHAARNPLAVFRKELTADAVLADPELIPGVMTRSMACPPTCGGAAALLVSERFARRLGLRTDVEILAQAMTTDQPGSFESQSMIELVGAGLTRRAAEQVYAASGIGPDAVDVVELHDCFAQNELITYEGLGLCPTGGGEGFVRDGRGTFGSDVVVNPSGGLLSKGHPLGATGLAQCFELTQQLRGTAGARQVEGARHALQHNLGLGGAAVVTMYGRRN